jgi:hypothetical protein
VKVRAGDVVEIGSPLDSLSEARATAEQHGGKGNGREPESHARNVKLPRGFREQKHGRPMVCC